MTRFVRRSGTWIPLSILVFLAIVLYYEQFRDPQWERIFVYVFGVIATLFGIIALVQIARYSFGRYPSFFILIFIYQKVFWGLTMVAATLLALDDIAPKVPAPPTDFVLPVFMAAIFSRAILDFALYFGSKYGFLDEQADPVPFRFLFNGKAYDEDDE